MRRVHIGTAAAAAALVLLTACGSGASGSAPEGATTATPTPTPNGIADKSPKDILAAAKAAAAEQGSVRVSGTIELGTESATWDTQLDNKGSSITTMEQGKSKVEALATGGKAYVRANEAFWTKETDAGAAGYEVFKDRWLMTSDPDQLKGLGPALSWTALVDELLSPKGTLEKTVELKISGYPAIGVSADKNVTIWVRTVGDALPIKLESRTDDLTFSEWGANVVVTPPPDKDVIDVDKMQGK